MESGSVTVFRRRNENHAEDLILENTREFDSEERKRSKEEHVF